MVGVLGNLRTSGLHMEIAHWEGARFAPRTWQAKALPVCIGAVKEGGAPIISAVTGGGKAHLLTELGWVANHKIAPEKHVIVVACPTQNLVRQLFEDVKWRMGEDASGMFFADVKQPEKRVIVTCYPSIPRLTKELEKQGRRCVLLICDECHRTEGETIKKAIKLLKPACRIGFTATAYRPDEEETLELWDRIAYRYTLGEAWDDGVLVPPEWHECTNEERKSKDLNKTCLRMMQMHDGPGVVSAFDIADCEQYADTTLGPYCLSLHPW